MAMNQQQTEVIEQQRMDLDIRMLSGCEQCERRVYDGERTLPGMALVPPLGDPESNERVILCGRCHADWLRARLLQG